MAQRFLHVRSLRLLVVTLLGSFVLTSCGSCDPFLGSALEQETKVSLVIDASGVREFNTADESRVKIWVWPYSADAVESPLWKLSAVPKTKDALIASTELVWGDIPELMALKSGRATGGMQAGTASAPILLEAATPDLKKATGLIVFANYSPDGDPDGQRLLAEIAFPKKGEVCDAFHGQITVTLGETALKKVSGTYEYKGTSGKRDGGVITARLKTLR